MDYKKIAKYIIYIGILIIPFLYAKDSYNHFSYIKGMIIILIDILLIGVITIGKIQLRTPKTNQKAFIIFGVFFLYSFIIGINSSNPTNSLLGSLYRSLGTYEYFGAFIFIFIISGIVEKSDFKNILRLIFTATIFISIIGIIQKYFPIQGNFLFSKSLDGRVGSTIGQYNLYGTFLLFGIISGTYCYNKEDKFKIIYQLLLSLVLVGIFISGSRIAIFAAIFILIYYLYIISKINLQKGLIISTLISILLLMMIFFTRFIPDDANMASIYSRIEITKIGIDTFTNEPIYNKIFGNGADNILEEITKNISYKIYEYEKIGDVPDRIHNIILDLTLEYGILGISLLLLGILYIFGIQNKKDKDSIEKIMYLGIILILMTGIFSFYNIIIILYLGILFTYFSIDEDKVVIKTRYLQIPLLILIYGILIFKVDAKEIAKYYSITDCQKCNKENYEFIQKSKRGVLKMNIINSMTKSGDKKYLNQIKALYSLSDDYFTRISSLGYIENYETNTGTRLEYYMKFNEKYPKNIEILQRIAHINYQNKDYLISNKYYNKYFLEIPDFVLQNPNSLSKFKKKKRSDILDGRGLKESLKEYIETSKKLDKKTDNKIFEAIKYL